VAYAAAAGPILVPKRVAISPGETAPLRKLAAFTTLLMVGSGAVTVNVTLMLVEPVPVPVPLTRSVPMYEPTPNVCLQGSRRHRQCGRPRGRCGPARGRNGKPVAPAVTCAVKPRLCPPPETLTVCGDGSAPPAWYVNDSGVVGAVTVAAACTRRVTGIVTTVPPLGVMVMVAVYVSTTA